MASFLQKWGNFESEDNDLKMQPDNPAHESNVLQMELTSFSVGE